MIKREYDDEERSELVMVVVVNGMEKKTCK